MTEQELAQAWAEFIAGRGSKFTVTFQAGFDDRDNVRKALGMKGPKYTGPSRYVIKKNSSPWALILTEQDDGAYTATVERV